MQFSGLQSCSELRTSQRALGPLFRVPRKKVFPTVSVRCAQPDLRTSKYASSSQNRIPADGSPRLATNVEPAGNEPLRLSKRMAELGICSRREADAWIERGWVSVDGACVDTLGTKVVRSQEVTVDRAALQQQLNRVTILLHKPIGYVSGQPEDGYRPASFLVGPATRWSGDRAPMRFDRGHLRGLAPAGRLDIDSTGLLVLTQDGRVAKQLVGEAVEAVEKEYLVRVEGRLSDAGLQRLNYGLSLDGVQLEKADVSWQNEDQLKFVLRQGRKRQIRRMCELVGLKVIGLKRVRIGRVRLGDLPMGEWRYLAAREQF